MTSPHRSMAGGWRCDAARIVEEIIVASGREAWDELLDLRGMILRGEDWEAALGLFSECRERLEADHYLPFYRLRQLLAASLRVEGGEAGSVKRWLARREGRFAAASRAARGAAAVHISEVG